MSNRRVSEEDQVRESSFRLHEAEKSRDIETMMEYFAEDAIALPPGLQRLEGREAIRKFSENIWFELPLEGFEIETSSVQVSASGDLAYEIGWYEMPGDGTKEVGKYVIVWRKVDGEWKYAVGVWNSDGPGT